MAVRTPKIATAYGALDSLAIVSGRASDAQILRTIARSANRLAVRSQPLLQLVYNCSPDDLGKFDIGLLGSSYLATYEHRARATPNWQRFTPGPIHVRKKPLLDRATLYAELTTDVHGAQAFLQVATDACPFDDAATVDNAPNVVEIPDGTSGFTLDDIPLRPGVDEHISYWIRGTPGTAPGSQGTDAERVVSAIVNRETLELSTPGWAANDYRFGFCVVFRFGTKLADYLSPRHILGNDVNRVSVFPDLPQDSVGDSVLGSTIEVKELALCRANYLSLYAKEYEP